jgi:hypothetical protein
MTRERAEALAEARAEASRPAPSRRASHAPPALRTRSAPLPRDVKALLAGAVLAAVLGFAWLVFGPPPPPVVPVLGYMDAGPPPGPKPTPTPMPPFKLPWWK